jgi:COMPASS component SPP1
MINCEICNDWFHGTCVSLEESDEALIDTYICPLCTAKGKGSTSWVRKCRLPECKKPAIQPLKGSRGATGKGSKYCSDEHAIQFFKTKLNELDTESITKEKLKALVQRVGIEEFKSLGDSEPVIPDSTLSKFKSPDDNSRLADFRLEKEKISRKMEILSLRQQFLHLVIEKAKQLNVDLKMALPQQLSVGKSKPKAKEICGYDERLSFDDTEFLEWSASEEGKRIFAERRIDTEEGTGCNIEKRRCRHAQWQALRGEDILMEESLLRSQLDGISREENMIRYYLLNRDTDWQGKAEGSRTECWDW